MVEDAGFSYSANASFQGKDTFAVAVSGAINGVEGESIIRISVSVASSPVSRASRPDPRPHEPATDAASTNLSSSTNTSGSGNSWNQLRIGAGGNLTGSSISSDNTYVVRTDTYGAYIWNPSATTPQGNGGGNGAWQQLINSSSMPPSFVDSAQLYSQGIYEIQVAYSNSSIMYMMYIMAQRRTYPPNSTVYRSTNKGATWTVTNFPPVPNQTAAYPNDQYRFWGQKMAVDPNDPNTVYVGTVGKGLWKTSDGGSSWTRLTNFPSTSTGAGITGMLVNPGNGSEVFAASYGNGTYHSTDGGSTWTQLTAGTGPANVTIAALSNNGTYFACDDAVNGNLWVWHGSTWSEKIRGSGSSTGCNGIAVNPTNSNHIRVVAYAGNLNQSTDGGETWSGFSDLSSAPFKPTYNASDIPWQRTVGVGIQYGLQWDQASPSSGRMLANAQNGFWNVTPESRITRNSKTTWSSQGVGIEQLVVNEIIVPPKRAATPLVASWDRAVFHPDLTRYPSIIHPVNDAVLATGWSIDYASSDPDTIVVNADGGVYDNNVQRSAISTDGGHTWTSLKLPTNASKGNISSNWGGNVAVSTASNMVFAPGSAGSTRGAQPFYTTDGGSNWTGISISGISNWSNFVIRGTSASIRLICADRVNVNTFYLLFPGNGIYKSTDGGGTWAMVTSAAASGSRPYMRATPDHAGDVWVIDGFTGNPGAQPDSGRLHHVTNALGSAKVTTISDVREPWAIGFGAAKPGNSYPAIYIVGWVGTSPVWGLWRSDDQGRTWVKLDTWPAGSLDQISAISGDPNVWNKVYIGFRGSGYAWRQF